jgi:hypothetical protein
MTEWTSKCERYAQENDHTLACYQLALTNAEKKNEQSTNERQEMWCYHHDHWEYKIVPDVYKQCRLPSPGILNTSNGMMIHLCGMSASSYASNSGYRYHILQYV